MKMALESNDYRLSVMGGVITELKILLASDLIGSRINVVTRSCNRVAHDLAALGCNLPSGVQTAWDAVP